MTGSIPGEGARATLTAWQRLLVVVTVLAVAFGGHISLPAEVEAAAYRTTANLNLRQGPGTSFATIRTIPSGATVDVTGPAENGFLPLTYDGSRGYASAQYLTASGGGTTTTGPTGTRYVVDGRLNLRNGPGTTYGIVAVMPDGAAVQLTGQVANGYSQVTWNGMTGWAATQYLSTSGGSTPSTPVPQTPTPTVAATTAPSVPAIGDTPIGTAVVATGGGGLNMRTGPGTSYAAIRSIPNGAQVDLMGDSVNGFRPVRYLGSKGWSSSSLLRIGSAPATPTPTATPVTPIATTPPATSVPGGIGDTPVATATVATGGLSLYMRSGPGSTFGVIRSIPNGAQVEVMGTAQAGYLPVRYLGTKGWSSATYLRVGALPGPTATPVTPTATPVTPTPAATTPPATASPTSTPGTGPIGTTPVGSATVTTVGLSLYMRSGPGSTYGVVRSIPSGATVDVMGAAQNGYLPVRYLGSSGWSSATYLRVSAATPAATATPVTPTATATPSPTVTPVSPTPTVTQTATPATPTPTIPPGGVIGTAVVSVSGTLNMRSGPGLQYPVIRGLANGAQVDLLGPATNGFRPIRYQGTDGWAAEAYLQVGATNPGDPGVPPIGTLAIGKATINATVSLRQGPATTYGHVQTLNSGWKVEIMGDPYNGWTPIRYNAAKGWVPSGNLTAGWGYPIVDQMITSRSQPMRTEPGGGGTIVIYVPPGTLVDITGAAQGNYVPARWAGRAGWLDATLMYQPETFVDPGPRNAQEEAMIAIIYQSADKWGQSRADMLRVARCESALNPNAVNPASGTSGLFQFMPSTFAFTPNGKRGENIFDPWSNADAAGWMWANGMRHHWACQ